MRRKPQQFGLLLWLRSVNPRSQNNPCSIWQRPITHLRFLVIRFTAFIVCMIRIPFARQVIARRLSIVFWHGNLQQVLLQILIVAVRYFAIAIAGEAMTFGFKRQRMAVDWGRWWRRGWFWRGVTVVVVETRFFLLLLISELAQRNLPLHIERPFCWRLLSRRRFVTVCAIVATRHLLLLVVRAGAWIWLWHQQASLFCGGDVGEVQELDDFLFACKRVRNVWVTSW